MGDGAHTDIGCPRRRTDSALRVRCVWCSGDVRGIDVLKFEFLIDVCCIRPIGINEIVADE